MYYNKSSIRLLQEQGREKVGKTDMKTMKMTALMLALVLMLCVFAGCGSMKWDELKNKDVVATVNGKEITKQHINYEYAQQTVSNQISAELMSQLGGMDEEEVEMDEVFYQVIAKNILGELAREKGFGITEEEAYERAYNDLILSSKKNGYDYLSQYNDQIKEMLHFDDDMMVEYASQDLYNTTPVNNYLKSIMEELQYDYPDETDPKEEALAEAVLERVKAEVGNVSVEFNYHGKSVLKKLNYEKLISNAKLTFVRAEDQLDLAD